MKNVFVFLIATVFCCTSKKENNPEIILESCKIIYTVPEFYLDSIYYESKIFFSYSIRIKNISDSNLTFINQFNFYDSFRNKSKVKIDIRFDYGKITIPPKDSINIEYLSTEKFSTNYNPKTINEEIFKRSDKLIKLTNIYMKKNNLFVKINKAPDFFTASEPISSEKAQKSNR